MTVPVLRRLDLRRRPADGWLLLFDALCCWLISLGVLFTLRQLFRFDNPAGMILLRSAVTTAAVAVLTRRWWIPPAAAGGVVLLVALGGRLPDAWDYVSGLFAWWVTRFPPLSPYNTPGTVELVQWLITLAVCALVFFLVRRVRLVSVLLFFAAALLAVVYLAGFRENRAALFFFAAGICPLLARGYFVRLCRRADGVVGSFRRFLPAAVAACTVGALLVLLAVPENTAGWKSPVLADQLSGIQRLWRGDVLSLQGEPFSLETSGLQPNQGRLGGDLHLSHTPVLAVETDSPTLLKGMVYSQYTGSGWEADPAQDFLLPSGEAILTGGIETVAESEGADQAFDETFGRLLPRDAWGTNPLTDAMPSGYAEVTLLLGGYSLYVPERLDSLASGASDTLLFNTRSEVFVRSQLPSNTTYRMQYRLFDRSLAGSRIPGIEWDSAVESSSLYDEYYAQAAAQYLALPPDLPASIATMAREIAAQETSPYRQAERLEAYLRNNYTYTLTPGSVPRDRDFVEYFLETGEGYCVYFASAMAVMARTLGIPSRFVIGYGLQSSGGRWMAYADTAHAWVECYIRGVGWVAFDPTAGSSYRDPGNREQVNPSMPEHIVTSSTLTSTTSSGSTTASAPPPTTSAPSNNAGTPGRDGDAERGSLGLLLGTAAALLLLAALIALRVIRRRRAFDLPVLQARLHTPEACAEAYYRDLLRQLRLLGLEPKTGETMRQFGQRAAKRLPETAEKAGRKAGQSKKPAGQDPAAAVCYEQAAARLNAALDVVMDWRYGGKGPSQRELETLAEAHGGLEPLVRRRLGAWRYFLRRRLF